MTKETTTETVSNWFFRQAGTKRWSQVANPRSSVSEIFPELIAAKKISNPFNDMNEKDVQWVGETDWEYKGTFFISDDLKQSGERIEMIIEGLDTYADVYINESEKPVLQNDNMFHIHTIDILPLIQKGENEIRIVFKSALLKGRELYKESGRKFESWNGDPSRVFVRKAQYHYGWDWGPILMTCGPFRPIYIKQYYSRIEDIFIKTNVAPSFEEAEVSVQVESITTKNLEIEKLQLQVEIFYRNLSTSEANYEDRLIEKKLVPLNKEEITNVIFSLKSPRLWYPHTHGIPHLYKTKVTMKKGDKILDQWSKSFGIRKVELIEEPLLGQEGASFYFKINGVPIFAKGSNWIPAHNFITQLPDSHYTTLLLMAIEGNQNMVRVWGGGLFEQDIFYEECDRLGIMVWQDFLFACAQYPVHESYKKTIKKEVNDQLKRLRNYCSIVIYAGNNEDYTVAESLQKDSSKSLSPELYAKEIYEELLPRLVASLTPSVPYHCGSPYGGKNSQDPTVGDIHQWNVWHGTQEKYQNWAKLSGRFISEFGMLALPNKKTCLEFTSDKSQLYPQSEMFDWHNKADGSERRLALYVMENFKVGTMDLDSWIYITQLMQSECLSYAYRAWRRNWKGNNKRYTGGCLVWQLDDCWPVTSWAIIDFYKRPKLAYYGIKRECKPIQLGIARYEIPNDFDDYYHGKRYAIDIWGVNDTLKMVEGELNIQIYNVETGEQVIVLPNERVRLGANKVTELREKISIPVPLNTNSSPHNHYAIYATFTDLRKKKEIACTSDWPQPLKYCSFSNRKVSVKYIGNNSVLVQADKPVKGVYLEANRESIRFDDNGFDVFPGKNKVVYAKWLNESDNLKVKFYGSDEQS